MADATTDATPNSNFVSCSGEEGLALLCEHPAALAVGYGADAADCRRAEARTTMSPRALSKRTAISRPPAGAGPKLNVSSITSSVSLPSSFAFCDDYYGLLKCWLHAAPSVPGHESFDPGTLRSMML